MNAPTKSPCRRLCHRLKLSKGDRTLMDSAIRLVAWSFLLPFLAMIAMYPLWGTARDALYGPLLSALIGVNGLLFVFGANFYLKGRRRRPRMRPADLWEPPIALAALTLVVAGLMSTVVAWMSTPMPNTPGEYAFALLRSLPQIVLGADSGVSEGVPGLPELQSVLLAFWLLATGALTITLGWLALRTITAALDHLEANSRKIAHL